VGKNKPGNEKQREGTRAGQGEWVRGKGVMEE